MRPTNRDCQRHRPSLILALLAGLTVCITVNATSEDNPFLPAHVVGVIDGDTIDVVVNPETAKRMGFRKRKTLLMLRVRIGEVDAPERGQAWSQRAKRALSDMVFDKDVLLVEQDVDRYDRTVAMVLKPPMDVTCSLDQINRSVQRGAVDHCFPAASVNAELVLGGHAWAYARYSDNKEFCDFELEARNARRGLWSQSPTTWIAPGDFRKQVRVATEPRSVKACKAMVKQNR